jgi:hypothetical protein
VDAHTGAELCCVDLAGPGGRVKDMVMLGEGRVVMGTSEGRVGLWRLQPGRDALVKLAEVIAWGDDRPWRDGAPAYACSCSGPSRNRLSRALSFVCFFWLFIRRGI